MEWGLILKSFLRRGLFSAPPSLLNLEGIVVTIVEMKNFKNPLLEP